MTHSEVIAGTPQYMAPEQACGKPVDHRADLFSLSSVMYAMCTGRPPFRSGSTMGTLRSVSDKRPRPIRQMNPDVPDALVEIIDRLHEKDPVNRLQSAAEVERLLGEQLARTQQPFVTAPLSSGASEGPATVAKDEPAKPTWSRLRFVLVAALLLIVGLGISEAMGLTNVASFVGTMFRITTPDGTVVVEVDDPNLTVTVDGKEIVIGENGRGELRLKPGSYEFGTRRGGVPGKPHLVTVTRTSGRRNPAKPKPVAAENVPRTVLL